MKTMFKKFAAILMAAVLLLCAIPFTASANSGYCGDNVTYSFDSSTGELTISGTGDMWDYQAAYDVPWFSDAKYVKEVNISYGVTSVGVFAFAFCENVASVTIPDGVTRIGERAFFYCTDLTNITIPNSVTSIGYLAFDGCRNLTDVRYIGTSEQWNGITVEEDNDELLNAAISYEPSSGEFWVEGSSSESTAIIIAAIALVIVVVAVVVIILVKKRKKNKNNEAIQYGMQK